MSFKNQSDVDGSRKISEKSLLQNFAAEKESYYHLWAKSRKNHLAQSQDHTGDSNRERQSQRATDRFPVLKSKLNKSLVEFFLQEDAFDDSSFLDENS